MLSLAITGTMIPCGAANLVPFNAIKPVVTPAVPITNSSVVSKNSSNGFSMQSLESKVDDIVAIKENTEQNKGLQDTYSGDCGDNAHWNLNTGTGVLTIFGSGETWNYGWAGTPWWNYRNNIKSVVIKNGITSIGNCIFHSASSASSIQIPTSVTSIGEYAFENWNALTTIVIPNSVTSIKKYAFNYCHGLVSVSIPNTVTSFGNSIFNDCTALTSVTINNDNAVENFKTIFPTYSKITTVTLGDGITSIPNSTFMGFGVLKSISVPATVESIGEYAFAYCTSLTDFKYLGTSNPTAVDNIFEESSSLKVIKVTSNYLDNECCGLPIVRFGVCGNNLNWELQPSTGALVISGTGQMVNYTVNSPAPWNAYKSDIKSINVGEGVKSIGNNALASCNNLFSINLPSSLISIGNSAFSGCINLSSVNFYGNTEPTNDKTAFSQCDSLVEVTVPTTYNKDTFCDVPVAKTLIVTTPTPTPDTSGTDPGGSGFSDENVTTNSTTSSGGSVSSSTAAAIVGALAALIGGGAGVGYLIKKCNIKGCNCCSCGSTTTVVEV